MGIIIKSFKMFENKMQKSHVIDSILKELKPTTDEMVEDVIEFMKKNEMTISKFERDYIYLELIYDMVKALNKYLKPDDIVKNIDTDRNRISKTVTISMNIIRDGNYYYLNSDVIYAGGYNIQRLHYRYIVKSNLPKSDDKTKENEFKEKLKRMTKLDKYTKENESFERRILKAKEEIEYYSTFSDDDIIEYYIEKGEHKDVSWEEIVRRGADKNYESEQDFVNQKEERRNSLIKFFKYNYIEGKERYIKALEKEIEKNNLRITKL